MATVITELRWPRCWLGLRAARADTGAARLVVLRVGWVAGARCCCGCVTGVWRCRTGGEDGA